MRRSTMARGAVFGTASALLLLTLAPASPATASEPGDELVAEASATALTVELAGQAGSGTQAFRSTHDGKVERTYGPHEPAVTLFGGQDALAIGTLAQDAKTSVKNGFGLASACSGIAGNGATALAVGDSGSCLTGGNTMQLALGHLDFTDVTVIGGDALMGYPEDVQKQFQPHLDPLLKAFSDGLRQGVEALGSPGLFLDVGAIQSSCTAHGRALSGASSLAGALLYLQLPEGALPNGERRLELVRFPANPGPNTEVVTGLDDVTDTITAALRTHVESAIGGRLEDQLGPLVDQLGRALNQIAGQISSQLQPLEDNLVRATLNAQNRSGGQIDVTALDLRILPAAQAFIGGDAAHIQVATSSCGPTSSVTSTTPVSAERPADKPQQQESAPLPTSVPAGLAEAPSDRAPVAPFVVLLLIATGVGGLVFRRTMNG